MRVYQIAKKHKKETKELLDILQKLGIKDKKSVSGLSEEQIKIIDSYFKPGEKPSKKVKTKQAPKKKTPAASKKPAAEKEKAEKKVVVSGTENIKILADKLNVPASAIIKHLMSLGFIMNINQSPGKETLKAICEFFGYVPEIKIPEIHIKPQKEEDKERLVRRAPVVTLMGHVDHGKTTILDAVRKSSIVDKEFGQITQKIGAYKLKAPEGEIVFLDTPGHEAFTAMRARGALVTDIVILVVAADDGVKPQTVEAINHAKSANVPIIVALNKIDKPNINIDKVKKQFAEHGLAPEEWGGETVFVNVSAIKGEGIKELLEMVMLMGEMLELKANPSGQAEGTVIESFMDKAKGPITTVLIQKGKLQAGDAFTVGKTCGKVRAMTDDWGNKLLCAGPATPVEILGSQDITGPGDKFRVVESEKAARKHAEEIKLRLFSKTTEVRKITLEDLYAQIQKGAIQAINLIIKTDYVGSIEAIKDIIEKIPTDEVKISIIHSEAGPITESDILLASASNAIVVGFNVPLTKNAADIAQSEKVEVRTYQIIYDLAEDIKNAVEGMLQPEEKEVLLGQAMVKQVFKLSDNSTVAGCIVLEGKIVRNSNCRVIRDGKVVHENKIASLKRFKENVKEVKINTECGIGMAYNDLEEGDIIQSYTNIQVTKKL